MKSPLKISDAEIKKLIKNFYSYIVEDLNFLPEGEDGAIYKFTSNKLKYIVKFIGIREGDKSLNLNDYYREIESFAQDNFLNFLSLPVQANNNNFVISDNRLNFAVFKFIEGDLWKQKKLNSKECENFGRLIAKLHNSNTDKHILQKETLSLDHINKLGQDLQLIEANEQNSENFTRLRNLVLPWFEILNEGIEKINQLKDQILIGSNGLVLTHGDLNPSNVIINNNIIKIIDCEGMILSDPERDLIFFSDDDIFPDFYKGYRELIKQDLNLTAFEFYKYKWDLESIGAWIKSIIEEDSTIEQLEHEYEYLQKDMEAHKLLKIGLEKVINISHRFE